jgi:hypothetical protein
MKEYAIWWNDLTVEAKEKLKEIYHDNIMLTPLAIINIEEE